MPGGSYAQKENLRLQRGETKTDTEKMDEGEKVCEMCEQHQLVDVVGCPRAGIPGAGYALMMLANVVGTVPSALRVTTSAPFTGC